MPEDDPSSRFAAPLIPTLVGLANRVADYRGTALDFRSLLDRAIGEAHQHTAFMVLVDDGGADRGDRFQTLAVLFGALAKQCEELGGAEQETVPA